MIKIIAVGKLKERFFEDAAAEYSKRISAYSKIQIVQVPDEKAGENLSEKEAGIIKEKEAAAILKHIKPSEYVISLEIGGKRYSSEGFAGWLQDLAVSGKTDIVFVIGGSIGLGDSVIKRADAHMSFSDLTFPHQLMRIILLEQIYRAFKIIKKEPYHK